MDLFEQYRGSRYEVFTADGVIVLRHGECSPALDALIAPAREWAFITAWNPGSRRLAPEENARRQRELLGAVRQPSWKGEGKGDGWSEESVLIAGIARADALALGRRFGQLAILAGRAGEAAEVVAC